MNPLIGGLLMILAAFGIPLLVAYVVHVIREARP